MNPQLGYRIWSSTRAADYTPLQEYGLILYGQEKKCLRAMGDSRVRF